MGGSGSGEGVADSPDIRGTSQFGLLDPSGTSRLAQEPSPEDEAGTQLRDDEAVLEFLRVMRRLRADCPWKAAQTHRSLARYLLEETHETLEALDTGDEAHLREELGDLLLQVFFHAAIAEQDGAFTMGDVARDITEKMVRRNPHVFGEVPAAELDPAGVNEVWEAAKAQEKQRTAVTDGLPPALPALLYADKLLDRLGRAGAPLDVPAGSTDLGDRLLALVAEARAAGTDPEQALRDAARRLVDRADG